MGNEVSTSTDTSVNLEHDNLQVEGLIPLDCGNTAEQVSSDIDNAGDNDNNNRITTERKYSHPNPSLNHSQGEFFSGGLLLGTLAAAEQDDKSIFRDPVLDAVAAGSAVRKKKQEKAQQIRQQRFSSLYADNEWKKSLRRLAKTASSTAKTVAHVTAPHLNDAKKVVVSSATEFAHDVKKEWEKGNETQFVNDEETVTIYSASEFTSTPSLHTRRGSASSAISFDLFATHSRQNSLLAFPSSLPYVDESVEESEELLKIKKDESDDDNDDKSKNIKPNSRPLMVSKKSSQDEKSTVSIIASSQILEEPEHAISILNEEENNDGKTVVINVSVDVQKVDIQLAQCHIDENNEKLSTTICEKQHNSNTHNNHCMKTRSKTEELDVQSDRAKQIYTTMDTNSTVSLQTRIVNERYIEEKGPQMNVIDGTMSSELHFNEKKEVDCKTNGGVGSDMFNAIEQPVSNGVNGRNDVSDIKVLPSENETTKKDFDAVPPTEISFLKLKLGENLDDVQQQPTCIDEKLDGLIVYTTMQDGDSDIRPQHDDIGKTMELDRNSNELRKDCERDSVFDEKETNHIQSLARTPDGKKTDRTLPLFDMNEDSIYQNEDVDTVQIRDGTGTNPEKKFEKCTRNSRPGHASFIPSFEENIFEDRKSIVKYVVTKLTGFDIEVKDKTHKLDLFDPTLSFDYPVVDSSSLSSPPEIQTCHEIEDTRSCRHSIEEMNEHISMFDFVPAKREISNELDKEEDCFRLRSNVSQERSRQRTLLKQEISASLNGSLDSLSTQQNSFNSRPFSTSSRRPNSRRLRRQGSKISLRSLINTKSARSPYETPIENRSLVDGKQTDLNPADDGCEMVRWDSDAEANFPSVPDTEEMTEAIERSELFHETLMAFSSLENLQFLEDFPHRKSPEVSKSMASLIWRQLVANWKHAESCRAMLTRPSSIPFSNLVRQTGFFDDEDTLHSSMSTINFRFDAKNVTFSNNFVSADAYSLLRNVHDDCYDRTHEDFLVLTRFLCDIGPLPSLYDGSGRRNGPAIQPSLRHDFSTTLKIKQQEDTPSITDIQKEAKEQLINLEIVVDCIVQYSTHNDPQSTDTEGNCISSSVGVKDYSSIRKKATRKYNGDVSQVKDALRGEITFPDEGSLICGLYSLHSLAEHNGNREKIGSAKSVPSFKIVRLKNLFRTTRAGSEFYHSLPTGYRHILVNLRLNGGLIAELQFQIAQFFGVMGVEGYSLHREIVSFGMENRQETITRNTDTQLSKEKKESSFGVSTTDFVRSVLTTPTKLATVSLVDQRIHDTNTTDTLDAEATKASVTEPTTKPTEDLVLATRKNEAKLTDEAPKQAPVGGIAAMAAQAALKKNSAKQSTDEAPKKAPLIGIAALAAQAALKKNYAKQSTDEASKKAPLVGIAAMAAQAALKRSEKKDEEAPKKAPVGGIAAMAAQAALKRSEKKDEEAPKKAPVGGIAAMATQAALKRSEKKDEEAPKKAPVGGIAAMAAQAALKRSEKKDEEAPKKAPVGGIAAMAAQAALKRSEKKDEEAPKKAPVGGIAAMAAQAALKRSEKKDEEAPKKAPVGGIAAMAAQAALKRSEKKDEEAPKKAPVGGIAAMAAQAALKKNSLKQSIDEAPKKAPVGGTASLILISAVFEAGIPEAISNPRHLPAFYCLHLLVTCMQQLITDLPPLLKEKEVSLAELSTFSRRLLLRTLAISNQATSMGMIGWLEYGSSNPFDRALNLPFEVLQQIACNMAVEKDWTKASDILSSLLMRCEQNLPPCHPTTLSAMLDLAGALTEAKKDDFAKSIISGLLDLLSNFLSETESLFFDRRYYEDYHETNSNQVVAFDDCVDAVDIMQAFAINFHRELSRDFLKLLGSDNRIRLLNHSLIADSFSVLANCLSASEEIDNKIPGSKTKPTSSEDDTVMSRYFWSMAYSQYDLALRGWTKVESLIHPNAASITLSIARCLRELGKLNQALKILETLASCLEQKVDEILATAKATSFGSDQNSIQMNHYRSSSSSMDRLAFISRRHVPISVFASASPSLQVITCEREQTTVLCLWMMAVLTVEQSPDEGGRCRALSLLHTASLTLQRALNIPDNYLDDHTRMVFLDLYDQIEGEALDIFEPLEAIQLMGEWEASYNNSRLQKMGEDKSSPRKKRAPWEISTPMREKRQWTSPRAIRRSRDASATRSGNAANFTSHNLNRNSHASVQRL